MTRLPADLSMRTVIFRLHKVFTTKTYSQGWPGNWHKHLKGQQIYQPSGRSGAYGAHR